MKRSLPWLGLVATVALAIYFLFFLTQSFSWEGVAALLELGNALSVVGAGFFYVLVIPLSGWAWSRLLSGMGVDWRWSKTSAIIGVTQIAKYVPGNVAQHVGRAAMALSRKMPPDVLAGSVLVETLLTMGAALLVGCVGLLWMTNPGKADGDVLSHTLLLTLTLLGVVLPGTALCFRMLSSLRGRSAWLQKWVSEDLRFPSFWVVLQATLAYSLNFLVLGAVLLMVCSAFSPSAGLGYFSLTAAFALAWLVGFLAPGLPAGLGAREGMLGILLAGQIPETELLNVLLGMRLATIGGDLLSFALGAWLTKRYLPAVTKIA